MSESVPRCGWCDEPAVTEVIIVPGRIRRRTAPVCARHARDFEERGQMTVDRELEDKMRVKATRR